MTEKQKTQHKVYKCITKIRSDVAEMKKFVKAKRLKSNKTNSHLIAKNTKEIIRLHADMFGLKFENIWCIYYGYANFHKK
jgi:hypothetical protein